MSNDAWHKARVEAAAKAIKTAIRQVENLEHPDVKKTEHQIYAEEALKAADSVPLPDKEELMRKLRSAIGGAIDDIAAQEREMDVGYIAESVILALRPWIAARIAK